MSEVVLLPEEVRSVEFYGDILIGALVRANDEAHIYVPIRPICDRLGIEWSAQYRRIQRDEVLVSEIKVVRIERSEFIAMMATNSEKTSRRGDPNVMCLPLEFLPGWLFGIETSRIKTTELRDKVILYRRECYRRLWDAFKTAILPAVTPTPPTTLSGAQVAYELATAVQNLARDQMELESRMGKAAQWAKGIESRVTALELHLTGDEAITETQAADLALAVKNVAHLLEAQGTTNGYGRVYGELYRRNGITSYKTLPRLRFDSVMGWLQSWYEDLVNSGIDRS